MFNLLTEPLVRYKTDAGEVKPATLPGVHAALVADEVASFPALRPHQRHAWHAFLVQLGTMALHQDGRDGDMLPDSAGEWARIIRGLTADYPDDEPWQLVVEDITRPAFMQPPATTPERQTDFKSAVSTPDELDMLVTSKNHDLKTAVADDGRPDDWVFALVTLQTMEGFGGAGNYGISRMNGGLGNRPAFSLAPKSTNPGPHVARDIRALLERRTAILDNHLHYPANDGIPLLWVRAWDGSASEAVLPGTLDLFYVEVCRRVRLLQSAEHGISAVRTSSRATRVGGQDLKGRTGDPWTPQNAKRDGLPLTLGAGGFNYKRVSEYLNPEEWTLPELMRPASFERRPEVEMQLVARAMVRGQGKTEGYHERIVPLRNSIKMATLNRSNADALAIISKARIDQVALVQRILSHAIQTFAARGDASSISSEQRDRARPWLEKHDSIIDATFFDDLQDEVEADAGQRDETRNRWLLDVVIANARDILRDAEDSLPCPSVYRYRARTAAESLFEGRIRSPNSGFRDLFNDNGGA